MRQLKKPTPTAVASQLHAFFELQTARVAQQQPGPQAQEISTTLMTWAEAFAQRYLVSRLQRSQDVAQPEIKKAQTLASAYIGEKHHDFFATCVDGRNMPAVMFSRPPHVGGVLRAPAGAVTGFMAGQKPGSVFIDDSSFVVQQIMRLLKEKAGETIFYGLDSHLGCAARGLIHSTEGGQQKDSGVYSDVKTKMMTARGIVELRRRLAQTNPQVAEIIPTFFSYDPHAGGVVAGLELHLDDEVIVAEGYTEAALDRLAKEGRIVRTMDLLGEADILAELQDVIEPNSADFRHDFAKSMLHNWQAITTLYNNGKSKTFQTIYARLVVAYENSGWKIADSDDLNARKISHRTLKQKAKFLLKNLLTRFSIAGAAHKWPFDSHREDLAVITDGGYAPFAELDAFAVFSRDLNALLPNTKLTIDLIRTFRRNGSAVNPVAEPKLSAEEFVAAPVVISNKAIFRTAQDATWATLAKLDLSRALAALDWDAPDLLNWQKSDLQTWLTGTIRDQQLALNMADTLSFVDLMYELFDRMRIMMKDKYFRQMILHGNIVVLHTIVDADRTPRLVLPLIA